MAFTIGGTKPKYINVNGVKCKKVTVNGTKAWSADLDLLETPESMWTYDRKTDSTGSGYCEYPIISNSSPYLSGSSFGGSNCYCWVRTKKAIDFSDYTTLTIKGTFHGDIIEGSGYATRACCAFGFSTNTGVSVTFDNGISGFGSTFDGGNLVFNTAAVITEFSYDITKLTGSYYIKLLTARAGLAPSGSFKVTKLILE